MAESDEERSWRILRDNQGAPFVRRTLYPNAYPAIREGSDDATVRLGTAHFPGPSDPRAGQRGYADRHWVYPDIVLRDGALVDNQGVDPGWARREVERGNAIPFDTAERAAEFAEGSWKAHLGKRIARRTIPEERPVPEPLLPTRSVPNYVNNPEYQRLLPEHMRQRNPAAEGPRLDDMRAEELFRQRQRYAEIQAPQQARPNPAAEGPLLDDMMAAELFKRAQAQRAAQGHEAQRQQALANQRLMGDMTFEAAQLFGGDPMGQRQQPLQQGLGLPADDMRALLERQEMVRRMEAQGYTR